MRTLPMLARRSAFAFPGTSSSSLSRSSLVLCGSIYKLLHCSATSHIETETHQPLINPQAHTPPPGMPAGGPRRRPGSAITAPAPPPVEARLKKPITSPSQLPANFGQNQVIPVAESVREELEGIVKTFKAPIRFAFAYGSGVFRQEGYSEKVSQISSPRRGRRSSWVCS